MERAFFGDSGQGKPCWSAAAYDRCLLLAAGYPAASIFLFWVFNGGVTGPAEAALGFREGTSDWERGLALFAILPLIIMVIWYCRLQPKSGWKLTVGCVIGAGAGALAITGASDGTDAVVAAGVFAVALVFNFFLIFTGVGVVAFAGVGVGTVVGTGASAVIGAILAAGPFTIFVASAVVMTASQLDGGKFYKFFLALFTLTGLTVLVGIVPAGFYFERSDWNERAALILFLPLLSLLNAPFDWLSLGLTRWLLRQGLAKRGWWALGYSLLDLIAALICLILLGCATILGIQAFNASSIINGGEAVFDPRPLLAALSNPVERWQPQYWWIYATVFSTFIPSLINLIIGSQAIWRGLIPLNSWIAKRLPLRVKIPNVDLLCLPILIAGQILITTALAILVLVGLLYLLVIWILPWFGFQLLEMLTDLAAADFPSTWFGG